MPAGQSRAGGEATRLRDRGFDFTFSEEDLVGVLPGFATPPRFLGLLTRNGAELLLESAGILPELRARGFPRLRVELDPRNGSSPTLRVRPEEDLDAPLIELRAKRSRGIVSGMELVSIEWLLLQNPRSQFTERRPRLPGQRFPGLGLLRDVMGCLVVACETHGLDGVHFVAAHYHVAIQSRRVVRPILPADEARLRALPAHLLRGKNFFDCAVSLVIDFFPSVLIIGGHAGEEMKDPSVFLIAVLNCFWPDGTINRDRLRREVRYLVRFLSSLLISIIVFVGIGTAPIVWVHSYIVPIPIIAKIFSVFHLDEETWEENVFTGQAGDVVKEYETWRKDQGMSRHTSMNLQKFLWHSWYILVAYGLYLAVSFYLLLIRVSLSLFFNYKRQVLSRKRLCRSKLKFYPAKRKPFGNFDHIFVPNSSVAACKKIQPGQSV